MDGVFFETGEGNRRVLRVARKLRATPAGTRIDALKGGTMMLQFTSKHDTRIQDDDNGNDDTSNQQRHAPVPA